MAYRYSQIALNENLPHVIVFKVLEEKVANLDEKVVELRSGQKKIEGDMKTLKDEMNRGFEGVNKSIGNLKNEISNDEIKKLREELGNKKAFKNTVVSGIIIALATIILTAIFSNLSNVNISVKEQVKAYQTPTTETDGRVQGN